MQGRERTEWREVERDGGRTALDRSRRVQGRRSPHFTCTHFTHWPTGEEGAERGWSETREGEASQDALSERPMAMFHRRTMATSHRPAATRISVVVLSKRISEKANIRFCLCLKQISVSVYIFPQNPPLTPHIA